MTPDEARRESIRYLLPSASDEQIKRLAELSKSLNPNLDASEQDKIVGEMGRIALEAIGAKTVENHFGWTVKMAAER